MTFDVALIEQTVAMSLQGGERITSAILRSRIEAIASVLNSTLSLKETDAMVKRLECSFQITMTLGSTLVDATHAPWLSGKRECIEWYYWSRYKQLLIREGFGRQVVGQMDIVTDEILDLLQNPTDNGAWQRKGLVVGHVQSGKTANYAGVVCKALDAGYRVVIILAGLLNSLRRQTQQRIDAGVVGLNSALILENMPLQEKLVGVGRFSCTQKPVSITTVHADFNRTNATQRQEAIEQYNQPLVFVIKKNVSILKNLIGWLKNNNLDLAAHPMLLIDDEADHASINTKKSDLDPTATNARIRELLDLFPKNVYLGYTATPFANIFINPDSVEDMMADLFPENFIKTLDAPSNYFGGSRVFIDGEVNAVRIVDDYETVLPMNHKIDDIPEALPASLENAIRVFVIARAVRCFRGQGSKHHSMLVNVSRFTGVQSALRVLIHNYLSALRDAVTAYASLSEEEALADANLAALHGSWKEEYASAEVAWDSIQPLLKKAISPINVIEVNSSGNAEKAIDYSERAYPEGRHLIAVGGLSLSRGITLEGLTVTYFLRNSIMYDTLMQMGRWFGYRTGYEDLCRIYMTDSASSWYQHIAMATEELRSEFKTMEALGKTPKDFGLRVRSHPDSLIVTARNKMRSSRPVVREIDLTGRLIETTRLFLDDKIAQANMSAMVELLERCKATGTHGGKEDAMKLFWQNVSYECVADFVASFQNHPESVATASDAVKEFVQRLAEQEGLREWNVLFVNVQKPHQDLNIAVIPALQEIGPGFRQEVSRCTAGVMLGQRKVASEGTDTRDLREGEVRQIPLLMLHLLDCRLKKESRRNESDAGPLFPAGVVAYGISFPGEKAGRRMQITAKYQVNKTWWRERYGYDFENDEDMKGEYE